MIHFFDPFGRTTEQPSDARTAALDARMSEFLEQKKDRPECREMVEQVEALRREFCSSAPADSCLVAREENPV